MTGEHHWVRCEGSGYPTHDVGEMFLCSMCGNDVIVSGIDHESCEHDRLDLLRMLDEGWLDG